MAMTSTGSTRRDVEGDLELGFEDGLDAKGNVDVDVCERAVPVGSHARNIADNLRDCEPDFSFRACNVPSGGLAMGEWRRVAASGGRAASVDGDEALGGSASGQWEARPFCAQDPHFRRGWKEPRTPSSSSAILKR